MAFEDRCSPNQAHSPGPVTGRVPQPHGETMQVCPQNQYTCTTLERFNMTIKSQPSSPPPSPYYNRPETPDIKPFIIKPAANVTLNFSINNILHPEFGSTALRKTNKIEGPKIVGPNHSILYKPYNLSKNVEKTDFERLQPLGGLRQTISQIGESSKVIESQRRPEKRPDSASSVVSSTSSGAVSTCGSTDTNNGTLWPAWVYCTRYSDRPSSGPRSRRTKKKSISEEKRPRTAFSASQLARLKNEFTENRYLTERRRQSLAAELGLAEAQIKIWFQNKRAKIKKSNGQKNPLAMQLMAQGLYNHSTVTESDEEEEISVT